MADSSDGGTSKLRDRLVEADEKSQENFDKTLFALSGGALGISFAYLKAIIGDGAPNLPCCLILAWMSWGASLAALLASHYTSHRSLQYAIQQIDCNTLTATNFGGRFRSITHGLNVAAASLFIAGLLFMTIFVGSNLGRNMDQQRNDHASKGYVAPPPGRGINAGSLGPEEHRGYVPPSPSPQQVTPQPLPGTGYIAPQPPPPPPPSPLPPPDKK